MRPIMERADFLIVLRRPHSKQGLRKAAVSRQPG
jgi:hypothetical protein